MSNLNLTIKISADGRDVKGTIQSVTGDVRQFGHTADAESKKATQAFGKTRAGVASISEELSDLKRGAIDTGKSMLAMAGVGLSVSAFSSMVSESKSVGESLKEVSTLLGDVADMPQLRMGVRELGREFGDQTQQAKGLYQVISAGVSDTTQALDVLNVANRLAVGGVTDVFTATDGLTTALNAYQMLASQAESVSDAFFIAMRGGKTTIGELSGSLGQVAPLASTAGVALEEVLAGAAALTTSGLSTSVAMTQLRAVISGVLSPSEQASKLAKELGIEFNLTALRSKGLAGFLEDLQEKTDGSADQIAKLFGSVEAQGAVFSLTGAQAGTFGDILQQMGDRAGATTDAVNKMQDGWEHSIDAIGYQLSALREGMTSTLMLTLAPALATVDSQFENLITVGSIAAQGLLVYGGVVMGVKAITLSAIPVKAAYASALAMVSGQAAVTATSLLTVRNAALALAVGFAGWQIGTWMRDEFLIVQQTGIALAGGLHTMALRVGGIFQLMGADITFALSHPFDYARGKISDFLEFINRLGTGTLRILGLDDVADSLTMDLTGLRGITAEEHQKTLESIRENTRQEVGVVGDIYAQMFAEAGVGATTAAKSISTLTNTTDDQTAALLQKEQATRASAQADADAAREQAQFEQSLGQLMARLDPVAAATEAYMTNVALLDRAWLEGLISGEAHLALMQQLASGQTTAAEMAAQLATEYDALLSAIDPLHAKFVEMADLEFKAWELFDKGQIKDMNELAAVLDKIRKKGEDAGNDVGKGMTTAADMADTFASAVKDSAASMRDMYAEGSSAYSGLTMIMQAMNVVMGIAAVVKQYSEGEYYTAWARGAAMIASVAALGISVGGSGSSGPSGSRGLSSNFGSRDGGMLGGGDSDSVAKSLDLIADNTGDLVAINRGMLTALQALSSDLDGVTNQIARTFGQTALQAVPPDAVRIMSAGLSLGGTLSDVDVAGWSRNLVPDNDWGSLINNSEFSLDADTVQSIAAVLGNMQTGIVDAATVLQLDAVDVSRALDAARIPAVNLRLDNKSPEEQADAIANAFDRILNSLVAQTLPELQQLHILGEGLGETLFRVASTVSVMDEAVFRLGISADRLDVQQFFELSDSLMQMAGGVDQFVSDMSGFVEKFAPEAHKFSLAQADMVRALDSVGLAVPVTRDAMWELVQTMDATTLAGREQIAMLLSVTEAADDYYSMVERDADRLAESVRQVFDVLDDAVRQLRGGAMGIDVQSYQASRRVLDMAAMTGILPDPDMLYRAVHTATQGVAQMAYSSDVDERREKLRLANQLESLMDAGMVTTEAGIVANPLQQRQVEQGDQMVNELRALRDELADLRAETRANVMYSRSTARTLERLTPDGDSIAVREVIG